MTYIPPVSPDDLALAAELHDAYAPRLMPLALGFTPNHDDASDLVFAACIKVARSAPCRRVPERTLPITLRRLGIDAYRHEQRQRQVPVVHGLDLGLLPGVSRRTTLGAAQVDLLHRAIEHLAAEDRELVTRRHLDGERGADIARSLGLSAAVVRKRLQRARARLGQILLGLGWSADGDHDDDFPLAA